MVNYFSYATLSPADTLDYVSYAFGWVLIFKVLLFLRRTGSVNMLRGEFGNFYCKTVKQAAVSNCTAFLNCCSVHESRMNRFFPYNSTRAVVFVYTRMTKQYRADDSDMHDVPLWMSQLCCAGISINRPSHTG